MDVISVDGDKVVLYHYTPSETAAYAFVALFAAATAAHVIMAPALRAAFMIPMIIGGICEAGGYYGRAWASRAPGSIKPFVLQSLLILAAPAFLAASVYMAYGRLTRALDTQNHFRRTGMVTKLYVVLDIVIFLSQVGGAGIQVTGDPDVMRAGRIAIVAGLIFQLMAFVIFAILVARVHRYLNQNSKGEWDGFKWRRHFWALYLVSAAVFVRGLIRAIEYGQGAASGIAEHEAYIYVFDAGLMLLVMATFLCFHPGFLLRRVRKAGQGKMEAL